jgi:hypothetical protein
MAALDAGKSMAARDGIQHKVVSTSTRTTRGFSLDAVRASSEAVESSATWRSLR